MYRTITIEYLALSRFSGLVNKTMMQNHLNDGFRMTTHKNICLLLLVVSFQKNVEEMRTTTACGLCGGNIKLTIACVQTHERDESDESFALQSNTLPRRELARFAPFF